VASRDCRRRTSRNRIVRDVGPGGGTEKTGPSGIGKTQYTWFLKNVLLVPLSCEDEQAITRRELARMRRSASRSSVIATFRR